MRAGWLLAAALAPLAGAIGTGVRNAGPEHPLLLERATLVLRAADITSPHRVPAAGSPGPGGTRTLMGVLRHDDRETVALWMEQAIPQAYRFDSLARTERLAEPMDGALQKWVREDFRSFFDEATTCYSPDGRWMVSVTGQPGQPPSALILSGSDGTEQVRIPDSLGHTARRMAWLPDSSGWVEVAFEDDRTIAREFDVRSPRLVRAVKLAGSLPVSDVAGVTQDHRLVMLQRDEVADQESVALLTVDLRAAAPKPVKAGSLSIPGAHIAQVLLSPGGSRVAFEAVPLDGASPKPTLAERLLERAGLRRTHYGSGLWVSRLDGSGLREIGRMVRRPGETGPVPAAERWTSDSRALTFVAQDAWYRVPAD